MKFIVALSLFISSIATAQQDCSYEQLCSQLNKLNASAGGKYFFKDRQVGAEVIKGGHIPSNEKAFKGLQACTRLNCSLPPNRRFEKLLELTKKYADEILTGRANTIPPQNASLSSHIKNVRLVYPQYNNQCKKGCQNGQNAYYMREQKKGATPLICVCPGFETFPDDSLVFLLAHELSHHISPCNFEPEGHPYLVGGDLSLKECLMARGIPDHTKTEWGESASNKVRPALLHALKTQASDLDLNCDGKLVTNSKVEEAYADWLGFEVAGKMLMSRNLGRSADPEMAVKVGAIFLHLCGEEMTEKLKHEEEAKFDSHPSLPDRINQVMHSSPSLVKALGCKPIGRSCNLSNKKESRIVPTTAPKPTDAVY